MAAQRVAWGTIILHLDNEQFQTAFRQGRSMYFDESEYDHPHVASHMSTLDAVSSVLDEDGKGGYCFDRIAFHSPLDILGFFLGYMSGPVTVETTQEREERHSHIVMLPEEACPVGRVM